MDTEYPGFENPFYSEFKYFCKKVHEAYNELKEDLTPYRDDRYYRLAPMRLYTLSKRHFVLVFIVFFICFGLTVFIGIAGPKIIEETTISGSKFLKANGTLKKCDEIIVVHLGYLNYTQYQIIVTFQNLQQDPSEIREVNFMCLFAHSLRKFSMRDWGIEQKWMSILLPLLLLYNGEMFLFEY
ncbi:TM181 protein, partial [Polypterus senegalus]